MTPAEPPFSNEKAANARSGSAFQFPGAAERARKHSVRSLIVLEPFDLWIPLQFAPVALGSLLLAGGLDVLRVISGVTEYQEFDSAGIAMASQISARTAPNSVILHAPTYNSPVFLTGRRSLLGYPGWMWSRGLDYSQRNADIQSIYSGGPDAGALLRRYSVDYVLVGPHELASFGVNAQFWSQYALLAQEGTYRLYKTKIEILK